MGFFDLLAVLSWSQWGEGRAVPCSPLSLGCQCAEELKSALAGLGCACTQHNISAGSEPRPCSLPALLKCFPLSRPFHVLLSAFPLPRVPQFRCPGETATRSRGVLGCLCSPAALSSHRTAPASPMAPALSTAGASVLKAIYIQLLVNLLEVHPHVFLLVAHGVRSVNSLFGRGHAGNCWFKKIRHSN